MLHLCRYLVATEWQDSALALCDSAACKPLDDRERITCNFPVQNFFPDDGDSANSRPSMQPSHALFSVKSRARRTGGTPALAGGGSSGTANLRQLIAEVLERRLQALAALLEELGVLLARHLARPLPRPLAFALRFLVQDAGRRSEPRSLLPHLREDVIVRL